MLTLWQITSEPPTLTNAGDGAEEDPHPPTSNSNPQDSTTLQKNPLECYFWKDNGRMAITCLRLCLHAFTGFITLPGQTVEKHMLRPNQEPLLGHKEKWEHTLPYYYHLKAIWETHSVWFFCGKKTSANIIRRDDGVSFNICRPRHSPSLSNYRCDLHILLNAIPVLLFGVINPLPLLQWNHPNEEEGRHTKSS